MLTAFLTLLQALWPFLKESFFGDQSVKEWLKQNRITCVWIVLLMIMLCVVFYLGDMVVLIRRSEYTATQAYAILKVQDDALKDRYTLIDNDLKRERERVVLLEAQRIRDTESSLITASKLTLYESWMGHCGMDYTYKGSGYPTCQFDRRSPPHRRPKPVDHANNVIERLKRWGQPLK